MNINFDEVIDRSNSDSVKWRIFDADVLPMWVADMDFKAPEVVIAALQARSQHGVFGYAMEEPALKETICAHLKSSYAWQVSPEDILFSPGVVVGFNQAIQALNHPGKNLLIQTPVYPPFFNAAGNARINIVQAPLIQQPGGRYGIDMPGFDVALRQEVGVFLLCNPHNPVGRVFRQDELEHLAQACLSAGVPIVSDEIHCNLIYSDARHIPIASLDHEIAQQSITLMAPSKTFNVPGLGFSFVVIQNPDLRKQYKAAANGLVSHVNLMGMVAAQAAYSQGWPWLAALMNYLEGNRNFLVEKINQEFPGMSVSSPEGTYLAWLDCRETPFGEAPCKFFLENARVGLNDGRDFGEQGKGFVRLNFGCPRSMLAEGLERMKQALAKA